MKYRYREPHELKESGIEWIGKIPEEWEVKAAKYVFDKIQTGTTPSTLNELYFEEEVNWFTPKDINHEILNYSERKISKLAVTQKEVKIFPGDSILIVGIGATSGKTGYLTKEGTFNQQITGLHSIRNNNKYLYYFMKHVSTEFLKLANFTTLPILNNEFFKSLMLSIYEDKSSQSLISSFLDKKCAEFDGIIEKKENIISKLEEAKKSLISEVVTGKVKIENGKLIPRKEEEMKESGIEWIGKIPKEWEVKKLKYIADATPSSIDKKSKGSESEILLCNYVDVYKNDFISSKIEFMKATATDDQIRKFILKKGDVILTKDSESPDDIGVSALVIESFENVVCGYHLTHITPRKILGEYLFRQFQCKFQQAYFEVSANGVTRFGLGVDKFNSALIINPSKGEQSHIADFLDKKTAEIDSVIKKIRDQIAKIKKAKQSLISEVVTGKIEVMEEK